MDEKQKEIGLMFNRIAKTYDVTNRVLSFGLDVQWRKKLALCLPNNSHLKVLDIACGTGDLIFSICYLNKNVTEAVGVDISSNMISFAEEKCFKLNLNEKISFMTADACELPFADHSFDVITIAFGIRNVVNIKKAFSEIFRVLKPGGLLLILEFSLPKNRLVKNVYLGYFRHILPHVGGLISNDYSAYKYLNKSVESFYSPDTFSRMLNESNFKDVSFLPLTFGVAYIYQGRKI